MNFPARTTIRRILCPIDLANRSDMALAYAITLARISNAKLFVCYCVDLSKANGTRRGHAADEFELLMAGHRRQGRAPLPEWEGTVLEGDPVFSIPREAAERHIDLVVICSGHRSHAATVIGSTAESICRSAPCPVLVTRPREREWVLGPESHVGFKRILIAHDFSEDSSLALSQALSLGQEYQAELHLVHVLPDLEVAAPAGLAVSHAVEGDVRRSLLRQLDNAIPRKALDWCDVKCVVKEGAPYRELLEYAEQQEMDLICMGVHGAGFGARSLFGSTADRVIRQASCPVLLARPVGSAISRNHDLDS